MGQTTRGLLKAARCYGRLSQAELARRAQLPRSVLNVYERGGREPSATALSGVLRAAGVELRLVPAVRELDADRASRILSQVLDLAEALPAKRRPSAIEVTPFRTEVPR